MTKDENMKIDIIVPCFKAHKYLPRLLGTIISQTIVDDLEVTLVNDADEKDYKDIVKSFKPYVKIKEVIMDKNGGPGVARQFGYDHTSNPLVTFIDADDTFAGAFCLHVLRKQLLAEQENAICIGSFVEEHAEVDQYFNHANDTVWMFGKLYKRQFLDKYKIRFNETRANEDNGFNMLCKLMSNDYEKIKFIPDIIYYWHTNPNSITRVENCRYSYDQSFVGYTDNMIWAIQEAEKRNPFNGAILMQRIAVMLNLYEYYLETVVRDERFIQQNWDCCKKFYREVYREVKDKIPEDAFKQVYNDTMRNAYMGDKLQMIIPCMGIYEFLDKLEEECKQETVTMQDVTSIS